MTPDMPTHCPRTSVSGSWHCGGQEAKESAVGWGKMASLLSTLDFQVKTRILIVLERHGGFFFRLWVEGQTQVSATIDCKLGNHEGQQS